MYTGAAGGASSKAVCPRGSAPELGQSQNHAAKAPFRRRVQFWKGEFNPVSAKTAGPASAMACAMSPTTCIQRVVLAARPAVNSSSLPTVSAQKLLWARRQLKALAASSEVAAASAGLIFGTGGELTSVPAGRRRPHRSTVAGDLQRGARCPLTHARRARSRPAGSAGAWDEAGVGHPVVRYYLGDNEQRWFMWYTGRSTACQDLDALFPSSGSIGECKPQGLRCAAQRNTAQRSMAQRSLGRPPLLPASGVTPLRCAARRRGRLVRRRRLATG